jgi:hypothetical protein
MTFRFTAAIRPGKAYREPTKNRSMHLTEKVAAEILYRAERPNEQAS